MILIAYPLHTETGHFILKCLKCISSWNAYNLLLRTELETQQVVTQKAEWILNRDIISSCLFPLFT